MRYETALKISPHRSYTREGFLICTDCALARTGARVYQACELPNFDADADGQITIVRDSQVLFNSDAIASIEGKPVTLGHPVEDVTPQNFKDFAVGNVHNVRPGKGEQSDSLIADLIITDAKAIKAIQDGVNELSLGYIAKFEPNAPGSLRETSIRGNHVAIVPKGRCGPLCNIQDSEIKNRGIDMENKKPQTPPIKDEGGEVSLKGIAEQIAALSARIAELEKGKKEPKSEEKAEEKSEVKDQAPAVTLSDTQINAIASKVTDALRAQEKANAINQAVVKDAAIVAPNLNPQNITALDALKEFAKDAQNTKLLDAWGGLSAIDATNANAILTAVAGVIRAQNEQSQSQGRVNDTAPQVDDFFTQAAKLWGK